ncbi:MAG: hypothetical protein KatS3mg029_0697 [Saprospiraceae bacterium]|nr:MAG: hypothetical protein KatS3mg029_0697 [Saprospiraceae bacterium]
MLRLTLFMALLSMLVISCGQGGSSQTASDSKVSPQVAVEDSLTAVVMEIHDVAMPRMGEINRLQRQLRQWLQNNPQAPDSTKTQVLEVLDWLGRADEGMMSWMAAFRQPANLRDSLSHEAIVAYLLDEQKRVQQVHDDIAGSIEAATKLLQTLNQASK